MGMPLDELEASKGGEKAWSAAQEPLAALAKLLHADESGPYLRGAEPRYADLVVASFLHFCVVLGEGGGGGKRGDVYERIVEFDGGYGRLYEGCEKWFERDGH